MARKYFTLCLRCEDGKFYPQFGDYDRTVVEQERRDMSYGSGEPLKNFRIIATGAKQADINAGVERLNRIAIPASI